MSRIRGTDTGPERAVRSLVHGMGYRYRLHVKGLPGTPDLVFPSLRKVIFVHGCFWHRHRCNAGQVTCSTNAKFWHDKFEGNVRRDRSNVRRLKALGWQPLTIWECWLRDPDRLVTRITTFLRSDPATPRRQA